MEGNAQVKVCFVGGQAVCADASCPAGEHCDTTANQCTFECRIDEDCGDAATCDARGSCIPGPPAGGGGCATGQPSGAFALLALVTAWVRRRRSS